MNRSLRPLAAALALLITMTGCSSQASSAGNTPSRGDSVAFTGPWASDLQHVYETSTTEQQRSVLKDGKITEAEVTELKDMFESCLSSRNLTVTWEGSNGEFSVTPVKTAGSPPTNTQVDDSVRTCQAESQGGVVDLYYAMARNPQNQDEREIMAACLVRVKLVPQGYSAKDYERDYEADPKPSYFDQQQFRDCVADPLNSGR